MTASGVGLGDCCKGCSTLPGCAAFTLKGSTCYFKASPCLLCRRAPGMGMCTCSPLTQRLLVIWYLRSSKPPCPSSRVLHPRKQARLVCFTARQHSRCNPARLHVRSRKLQTLEPCCAESQRLDQGERHRRCVGVGDPGLAPPCHPPPALPVSAPLTAPGETGLCNRFTFHLLPSCPTRLAWATAATCTTCNRSPHGTPPSCFTATPPSATFMCLCLKSGLLAVFVIPIINRLELLMCERFTGGCDTVHAQEAKRGGGVW